MHTQAAQVTQSFCKMKTGLASAARQIYFDYTEAYYYHMQTSFVMSRLSHKPCFGYDRTTKSKITRNNSFACEACEEQAYKQQQINSNRWYLQLRSHIHAPCVVACHEAHYYHKRETLMRQRRVCTKAGSKGPAPCFCSRYGEFSKNSERPEHRPTFDDAQRADAVSLSFESTSSSSSKARH